MKAAALRLLTSGCFVAGLITAAQAQSSVHVDLHPIPKNMPPLLFAPDLLGGTALRPTLAEPADAATAMEAAAAMKPEDAVAPAQEAPAVEPAATGSVAETPPEVAAETVAQAQAAETPAPPTAAEPQAEPESAASPLALAKGETHVTVIVENVESDQGTVNVAVCDKGLSREGCPYDKGVTARPGFVEAQFRGIPPGEYAVVGYHDVNSNERFDRFLGVPREPYALSGRAGGEMVPTFEDAVLTIKEGENVVIIRLQRFGS